MKRILVLVLAMSAFSVPSVIQGLGLGELELNSTLNQSFDARIVLLKAKPEELDSLTIGLADMDAFRKAGIDRPFILSKLRFQVISNETGPDYIRITSPEAIREPFLDFLIEVNWSRGRLLREYTVLLDPPVYEATVEVAEFEAPEAAAAPTRETPSYAAPVEAPKMVESRPSPPAPSAPDISHDVQYGPGHIPDYAPHPAAVDGEYGPVIAGDTLWSLAKHFRPDTSVSVQQMMLALLRANPNAFSRDNVNGLYKGHILRIPDRDEVTALNKAEALAEVKGQYALWDEYRQTVASTAGLRTVGAGTTEKPGTEAAATPDEVTEESELKLVSPSKEGVGTVQQVAEAPADGAPAAELSKKLALVNETVEALRQENVEFKNRLEESEELVIDLRRLISLKDDQLAALQAELAKRQAEPPPLAPEELGEVAKVTETSPLMEEAGLEEGVEEEVVVVSGPESEAGTSAGPMAMVQEILGSVKDVIVGFADTALGYFNAAKGFVMGNTRTMLGVAGGLVLLLLGYAVVVHRRRRAEAAELIELPGFADEDFGDTAELGEMEEVVDVTKAETVVLDAAEMPKPATSPPVEEVSPAATEAAPSGDAEEDPLAEINIYLAYERFDQAEEFVKAAMEKSPDRHEYKLKLLEVYYAANNKKAYEEYARELRDAVGGEGQIWEMAVAMWQEMSPDRALFETPKPGEEDVTPVVELLGASTGSDVLDITRDEEPIVTTDTVTYAPAGEEPFEEATSVPATASQSEEDAVLDFELDVSDTTEPGIAHAHEVLDLTRSGEVESEEEVLDLTVSAGEAADTGEEMLDVTGGTETEEGIKPVLDITAGSELTEQGESMLDITAGSAAMMSKGDDLLDVSLTSEGTLDTREDLLDVTSVGEPELGSDEEADEAVKTEDDKHSIEFDISESEPGSASEMEQDVTGGADVFDISSPGGDIDVAEETHEDNVMEVDLNDAGSADELEPASEAPSEQGLDFELVDMEDTSPIEAAPSESLSEDTVQIPAAETEEEPEFADTVSMPRAPDAEQQTAADEAATKLDLAKAYIELGDSDSAKTILDEVVKEGTEEQKQDAQELLKQAT